MKNKTVLMAFCVLLAGAAVLILSSRAGLRQAPDITFNIIDGRQIRMEDLRGRPVLVTFWATSCRTCLKEIPHLVSLHRELSGHGFALIGVAMAYDPPNRVLDLVRHRNLPYAIALDIDGAVARAFDQVTVTPTSFLIDPDGRIISQASGALDMNKLHAQITKLLQPPATAGHLLSRGKRQDS